MELLVNSMIGWALLIFGVVRGLLEWSDKALLAAAAVAAGAYLGTRLALNRFDGPVRGQAVAEH